MRFAPSVGRRRRARQRLREDGDLLAVLLDSVCVAIVAWGADGRLTHVSRRTEEILGDGCALGSEAEAWVAALRPRTPSGILLVAEDLPPVRALQGEAVRGVDVLVQVDGADLLLGVTATPVYDRQGRRRGALALLEDVTERRRAEAQLRGQGGCQYEQGARRAADRCERPRG
jgi:PAS domain-containing protein